MAEEVKTRKGFWAVMEGVLCVAAGAGASILVKNGVNMLTPEGLGTVKKLCCKAAEFALTGAVIGVTSNEIGKTMDVAEQITGTMKNMCIAAAQMPTKVEEAPVNNTEIVEEETENAED